MAEGLINILREDLDEEVLRRMPAWFKVLREAHARQAMKNF